jgi:hypothetical protein
LIHPDSDSDDDEDEGIVSLFFVVVASTSFEALVSWLLLFKQMLKKEIVLNDTFDHQMYD